MVSHHDGNGIFWDDNVYKETLEMAPSDKDGDEFIFSWLVWEVFSSRLSCGAVIER